MKSHRRLIGTGTEVGEVGEVGSPQLGTSRRGSRVADLPPHTLPWAKQPLIPLTSCSSDNESLASRLLAQCSRDSVPLKISLHHSHAVRDDCARFGEGAGTDF